MCGNHEIIQLKEMLLLATTFNEIESPLSTEAAGKEPNPISAQASEIVCTREEILP